MSSFTFLPIPIDRIPEHGINDEPFVEIHLDELFNLGENMQLCRVWKNKDSGAMLIDKTYRIFYDANKCIDFISSYQWRKVFLILTDHFSFVLELLHNLPQIVYFYIYSTSPENVPYKQEDYPKLRAIVKEYALDADKQLLEDIDIFKRDLMPINIIKPIKRKTKLLIEELSNIDEYTIVWLQNSKNCITFDTSLFSDVIKSLKIFFDFEKSIDFIKSSSDRKISFCFTSSSVNETRIETIAQYAQTVNIYILKSEHELIISQDFSNSKLRGIYTDIQKLIEVLSKDYECHLNHTVLPMSIFLRNKNEKTVRDLNKDNTKFLWFQLLVDILIKIPYNDQAKEDMLDVCRQHYGIPCENDQESSMIMDNFAQRKQTHIKF